MKRILVIFSHPALQSSRANKQLLHAIEGLEGITLHDLYQRYLPAPPSSAVCPPEQSPVPQFAR